MKTSRPDKDGAHRLAFERNKRKILATETVCAICGKPVDKKLHYPDPMSPSIDHIIPIDRGGHPSDIQNLQLTHWKCNRTKGTKLMQSTGNQGIRPDDAGGRRITNRDLPLSRDWSQYRGHDNE